MQAWLDALSQSLQGAPLAALTASFVWGVLSILLSPCHLSSIPLIVGFIGQQGRMSPRRALLISSLFALGILVTIGLIGLATAGAGRLMGDLGAWANYLVAAVFFAVGLHLLGIIPMLWSGPGAVNVKSKGPLAALALGLVFGLALGPCTFAYMAPMLGITFRMAQTQPLYGALLLGVYGLGHCSVIVLAGVSMQGVQRYLNWNERSGAGAWLRAACGVLVLAGGLWLLYTAP